MEETRSIFPSQTRDDILLRDELETLASDNKQFSLWYTLDRPPQEGRSTFALWRGVVSPSKYQYTRPEM